MIDADNFKYKVLSFDLKEKMLVVSLDDGGSAEKHIPLMTPFPTTPEELDIIVRQFALPKELVAARNAPADGLEFITDLVGKEREAPRFSFAR